MSERKDVGDLNEPYCTSTVPVTSVDGCEARCVPCARVRPCVPCVPFVSRLPPVSFYR